MSRASSLDACKQAAARKAVEYIRNGMIVGLGTGSTARHLLKELGEKVRLGLKIRGVPTSKDTRDLARQCGIALIDTVDSWNIDIALDGADQVDPALNLIKGGGGALLKEKIVAAAARRLVIMVDYTKRVPVLGDPCPLPVEVVPFGWGSTAKQIEELGLKPVLRKRDADPYVTEAGHYILDVHVPAVSDPAALERQLKGIPGVVETGLFVGRTSVLIVGTPQGVEVVEADH
jgi:ribose 5-phosphate isomerase A